MRTRYGTRARDRREEERLELELHILEPTLERRKKKKSAVPHDRQNKQTKAK